jgi:hypothetical protein
MLEIQNALGLADNDDAFLSVFDEQRLRNLGHIRKVVFYGLKGGRPDVTEGEAGDLITEVGLIRSGEIIREALRWALPQPQPAEPGSTPRPSGGPPSSRTRPGRG